MVKIREGLEKVKEDYRQLIPSEAILRICQIHGYLPSR